MKIALIKMGEIGDVLMTTPLLRQLRTSFPDAAIEYLVGSASAKILEGNKNVDRVLVFDSLLFAKWKVSKWFKLIKRVRKNQYDVIFVLDKHWVLNLTAWLCGVPRRLGFNRMSKEGLFLTDKVTRDETPRHEIFLYLDLAQRLGVSVEYDDVSLDLVMTKEELKSAKTICPPGSFVVLVNSGGVNAVEKSGVRKLPDPLFGSIVEGVSKEETVVLLGSLEEKKYYDQFVKENVINLAGKTKNIKGAAAVLSFAKKVVCTDSGLMHITAAVETPLLALFGPTDPSRKAPLSKNVAVIWKGKENYDFAYDMYGTIPEAKEFFRNIKVNEVLHWIK